MRSAKVYMGDTPIPPGVRVKILQNIAKNGNYCRNFAIIPSPIKTFSPQRVMKWSAIARADSCCAAPEFTRGSDGASY